MKRFNDVLSQLIRTIKAFVAIWIQRFTSQSNQRDSIFSSERFELEEQKLEQQRAILKLPDFGLQSITETDGRIGLYTSDERKQRVGNRVFDRIEVGAIETFEGSPVLTITCHHERQYTTIRSVKRDALIEIQEYLPVANQFIQLWTVARTYAPKQPRHEGLTRFFESYGRPS